MLQLSKVGDSKDDNDVDEDDDNERALGELKSSLVFRKPNYDR